MTATFVAQSIARSTVTNIMQYNALLLNSVYAIVAPYKAEKLDAEKT